MKQITYFLSVLCALFMMSSCATTSSMQSNKLATYTGPTTVKSHQKIMLVMYGNVGWDDFYKRVGTEFKNFVEKEHEIDIVYRILTPLSFETQSDIDQAIKKEKADFVIEIAQGPMNRTAVAVPVDENISTTSYIERTDFLMSLKSTEVNQVFWKATTNISRSAVGYLLSRRLFTQLKKDGIITGGQLSSR
jgi:hypothetical protein